MKYINRLVLTAVLIASSATFAIAQSVSTPARHAILVEVETGEVLFEKDADTAFPPASMSKTMTVYVAFDMIRNAGISLDDTTIVSRHAWENWRLRGSTMFLNAGDEVTIGDLLKGIIVQSGNDACVVLAEALAGSEEAFVEWMNDKAEDIGLTGSHFVNTTGWPADGHVMTARDLAVLAQRTQIDFPELYAFYGMRRFEFGPESNHNNRNPLLYRMDGADGLKTGHTEESGYGLTGSAVREGRRLVLVVAGLESERQRARESERLMNFGFRNFSTYELFAAGETVDHADVWLGEQARVPLVVRDAVKLTMSRRARNNMSVTLAYDNPVPAPISEGQPIATLTVDKGEEESVDIPVFAGATVGEQGGFGRIGAAFGYLLFGSASTGQ